MKKRIACFLLALLMVLSILPPQTFATDVETDSGKHPMMGELVAISPSTGVYYHAPGGSYSFVNVLYFADRMEIVAVDESTGTTYYQLNAAPGCSWKADSLGNVELHDGIWVKASDTIHLVYCEDCKEYNCGIDHTTDPSNPSDPVDPNAPSISATVVDSNGNEQTVTVSGEALPEGIAINIDATVIKTGAVNVTDYDISFSVDGEAYEPEANTKVTITGLDVTAESFVKVIHYLEDIEEIQNGYNAGTIQVWTDATISAQYPTAAAAAYEALGMADTVCVELFYSTEGKIFVGNGSISFNANSFSIYTVTSTGTASGRAYSVYNDDGGAMNSNGYSSTHEVTMDDSNNATYMLTRGQKFYVDIGPNFYEFGMAAYNWKISSGDLGKFDNGKTVHEGGLGNYDEVLTVSSSAPFYTKYTLQVYNKLKTRTINIYVVPEVKLSFNANIPAGATSNNVNVPATQTTVLGDGSTDVRYTRLPVTNPTGSVTGYTFSGWYTAATGGTKVSSGSYVFLDNDNATYIGGTYNDQYEEVLYAHWDPITYTIKFNANGGTGSMDAQTMTYDQAATLNENQFTSPQTGYVFSGWATSPTGGVVYSDKQSVSNLASTQDAVVNLYAVWTNTMEFTDVRIGLNESYWFTDYKYTVTADGVASSSYHAFPAEPAVQSILYTRETKDDNGNWVISDNAELPGTASLYIDPSIVYSNLFRSSVIATDSTWGVADPTGADTKAFLKFTEADYTAMIKVWLQSMADRTDDTPNADGTYNINCKGTTHITDVNWNEEVNNWEEYEVIPYVIKMEKSGGSSTYNCWRIDMIIAPMRYLTLSYDLNINTAIGYSLTGGSSIPNTQYERDTTQNVLASPHAYNSNIEVSRTVNGVKYTAQFLYWEDEQGNKYGTGYNSTVLMDGHKNLKAIWRYPDQTMGSLRVEKDVTVPVNTGLTPNKTQAFTITVKLGTSGSYPYTKYSSTGIVTETSSFTGTTKSFTLKADEYVIITGINQGITYTVSETAPTGYTNKSGTITGTIQAGNTMSATVVNEPSSYKISFDFNGGSNANTSVTAVYGSTNYYDVSWLNPTRTGYKFTGWYTAKEDGTQVYTDTGFCMDGAYWSSNKWIGTADLPLYAQWEVHEHNVTYQYTGTPPTGAPVVPATVSTAYGTSVTVETAPTLAGYTFSGWTTSDAAIIDGKFSMPDKDVTLTGSWTANKYNVTYQYTGTPPTGAPVVPATVSTAYGTSVTVETAPTLAGYTFSGWTTSDAAIIDGKFSMPDKDVTLFGSWTVNDYTVSFDANYVGGTNPGSQTVTYGGKYGTLPTITRSGYRFDGWFTEASGGTQVTADTVCKRTENHTLYAHWTPLYTVTVTIDEGGTIEGTFPPTVASGTTVTVTYAPKVGYLIKAIEINGTNYDEDASTAGGTLTLTITSDTDVVITTEKIVYTVTFKDWDDTVLESKEWTYGETPYYDADGSKDGLQNPVRASDEQYDYEFADWTPQISAVTGDATYTATYTSQTRSYTITWVDGDGTTLQTATWAYNTMPQYTGSKTPTKAATDQYTYTFNNQWSPEISKVTGDATYTAQFDATVNKYTITWEDGDGNTLKTEQVEYGKTPVYSGEKPTKTATDQYTYTFNNKWSPEIATVTGNATYTAQFDATVNKYKITWVDGDGNTLKTEQVEYGKTPVYSGENPTKTATPQYTYTWNTENPWSPAIVSVTGDATYTAQFTQSIRTYTVTWWQDLNENDTMDDGEVLETDKNVPYGGTPSFDGNEPQKEHDSEYYYLFAGWNPSIIDYKVTGDVSFKAQFKAVLEYYDVVWKNRDGTTLETDEDVLYGQMPEYNGETPVYVPEPDDGYTYTFDSWTPVLTPVFNTQEYVAVYTKTKIPYSITYDLNGGALPAGKSNPTSYHVETETFPLHNPERTGYTFTGWTGSNVDTPQTSVSVVTGTTGNLTFTANWQAKNVGYKVVHWKQSIGGGSEHNETNFPHKETEDLTAEADSKVKPTVKNYEGFTAPIEVEVTIEADGSTVVNYYYTRNTYTIHFNANAGTGTMDSLTLAYDQSMILTANAFARKGYSFKGWATAADGGVVYADQKEVKNLSVQNGARIDLYAVWEINLFNLIIKTNNFVDENQSYIFTVSGTGYDGTKIRLQVALGANDEQKIVGVPAGIYTVADQNGWSWRYEHQEIKNREVVTDQVADFNYTYSRMKDTKIYWLNGYGNDLLRMFDNKRKK